jgi:hypothetical protein
VLSLVLLHVAHTPAYRLYASYMYVMDRRVDDVSRVSYINEGLGTVYQAQELSHIYKKAISSPSSGSSSSGPARSRVLSTGARTSATGGRELH